MRELATALAIANTTATDCYEFTAGVVFEVTGRDFRRLFQYQGVREYTRIVRGSDGLLALATQTLGEPCDPSECRDGDPVLVRSGREMLGVKFQDMAIVKTGKHSYQLPLAAAVCGWSL